MYQMQKLSAVLIMALCVALILLPASSGDGASDVSSLWLGVKAPPLGELRDRIEGRALSLDDYHGTPVLLYSFDAGSFGEKPDLNKLCADLASLYAVRDLVATNLAVIGFTRGIMFFGMGELPASIQVLADFPIVNLNNKRGDSALSPPYDRLKTPGAILVDQNGVIAAVQTNELNCMDLMSIARVGVWEAPMNAPPRNQGQTTNDRHDELVLVAARALSIGDTITIRDMAKKRFDVSEIPLHVVPLESAKTLIGLKLRSAVPRGMPLTWDMFDREE